MGTGPRASRGFDLALTELLDDGGHRFSSRSAASAGAEVLGRGSRTRRPRPATSRAADQRAPRRPPRRWAARSTSTDIRDLLYRNREHPRWDEVADRCLTCGNCTMVCPTCFCSDRRGRHRPDRRGGRARARAGTPASRSTTPTSTAAASGGSRKSRYRQWMTHKLATWIDQFGTSGCVGCGRCITWCPVAIDITEEAAAIRATDLGAEAHRAMRTIDELLSEVPAFDRAGLRSQLELIAGCAVNRVVRGRRARSCARASRPTPST